MDRLYHSSLSPYTMPDKLPLWVEHVTSYQHPERWFHDHDYSELALVLKGGAVHLLGERSAPIAAGDVLVIHPGCLHAYDKTAGMELANILYKKDELPLPLLDALSLPLFQRLFPSDLPAERSPSPVMRLKPEDLSGVAALVKELEGEVRGILPGKLYVAMTLFMEVTAKLARLCDYEMPERRARFLIGDAIEVMNNRYAQKLSVEELMRAARMSRRNFFRQFKGAVGHSPIEHLLGIRLEKAARMLVMTDRSVDEIALACGFCDGNYFCRMFRKKHQCSPRQYRIEKTNR